MNGTISTTVVAGPVEYKGRSIHGVGHQLSMAETSVMLYLTPETAQQWLPIITKIAEETA
jgi:hypothetical protein